MIENEQHPGVAVVEFVPIAYKGDSGYYTIMYIRYDCPYCRSRHTCHVEQLK